MIFYETSFGTYDYFSLAKVLAICVSMCERRKTSLLEFLSFTCVGAIYKMSCTRLIV